MLIYLQNNLYFYLQTKWICIYFGRLDDKYVIVFWTVKAFWHLALLCTPTVAIANIWAPQTTFSVPGETHKGHGGLGGGPHIGPGGHYGESLLFCVGFLVPKAYFSLHCFLTILSAYRLETLEKETGLWKSEQNNGLAQGKAAIQPSQVICPSPLA